MSVNIDYTSKDTLFSKDKVSALDAISKAQFIAFAPYVFQASVLLRDSGILESLSNTKGEGLTLEAIQQQHAHLSAYAVRILLEAGLGIGLVIRNDERYNITKTGLFFIHDQMTIVNTNFMKDVCYDGAQDLEASLTEQKPVGLRHFGDWSTIYPALSLLPEKAKDAWFKFDHFYSDNAFPLALDIVFQKPIKKLLDIGGNTGKWTLSCLNHNTEVEMGIADLPPQIAIAQQEIAKHGYSDRVQFHPLDILDSQSILPTGYDAMWMSQFLDCFSDDEIVSILTKCHKALNEDGVIFINETFWDRQRFPASAFALQMTSLYFTTMANGNSQMYDSQVFFKLIDQSGFQITAIHDNIGLSHTILEIRKK